MTVNAYVEALRAEVTFPPIKVQRVFNYPKDNEKVEATLILDGIHRGSAFKEYCSKTIAVVIIRLSLLGWAQEHIAHVVGISRGRIAQIINNTNFGKINNLLSQGREMRYITGHYQMDLALARALGLEGKTDQEKFEEKGVSGEGQ